MGHRIFLIFLNAFAGNVGQTDVQITNQTGNECRLVATKVIHGKFSLSPPQSISVNQPISFIMEHDDLTSFLLLMLFSSESSYLADMVFTYQCSNSNLSDTAKRMVKFEIKQHLYCNHAGHFPEHPTTNEHPDIKTLEHKGLVLEIALNQGCYVKGLGSPPDDKPNTPDTINLNIKLGE